jgi:hypothetical protein
VSNRPPFAQLKEYPPAATISSLQTYLRRYQTVVATGIEACEPYLTEPTFQDYLFRLTKKYNAKDLKRFTDQKRYALMVASCWKRAKSCWITWPGCTTSM